MRVTRVVTYTYETGPGDHVLGHVALSDEEFELLHNATRRGILHDTNVQRARAAAKVYDELFGPDLPEEDRYIKDLI